MPLTATVSRPRPAADPFMLTFNSIKNASGKYQHRNGNVLVIVSDKGQLVKVPKGVASNGFSRTGMFMIDAKTGKTRHVNCGQGPDGDRNWMRYTASVTL